MATAAAAAAPPAPAAAGAGERLAAALQGLGDALRLEAQAGLVPKEVQELVGSWDVRSQALVGALTGSAEGGLLEEAQAAAAAELLQPLLREAFVAAHPELFAKTMEASGTIAESCSHEVGYLQQRYIPDAGPCAGLCCCSESPYLTH
jgi:hypothetical protein